MVFRGNQRVRGLHAGRAVDADTPSDNEGFAIAPEAEAGMGLEFMEPFFHCGVIRKGRAALALRARGKGLPRDFSPWRLGKVPV